MQIVRFKTDTNMSYGALEGGDVVEYSGTPWGPFRRGRRRVPLNDVTARDLASKGFWLRAKAFDTFCPLGPCIATAIDPDAAAVETFVNGDLRQSSSTKELILPAAAIVARRAQVMTLLPGDVVARGPPAGPAPLR